MPHATLPNPGLQAFILCGPGVSLNTFTSIPKDLPKALIPVANRPMVWYPMEWCHRMGISNVSLISPAESVGPLEAALATHPALTNLPSPKIIAPDSLLQTTGTGEILRLAEVQKSITSDFVILPCDLVTELDGNRLVQQWMTLNPLVRNSRKAPHKSALSVFYPTYGLEGISHKKDETDFLATTALPDPPVRPSATSLRSDIEHLVVCMPSDSLNDKLTDDRGFLRLRQSLLEKYSRVKLRMKHRDAHIYIFPKWVKEFALRNEKFDSISEDVLGWWAKAQWQEALSEKLHFDDILGDDKTLEESVDALLEKQDDDEFDPALLSSSKALTSPPVPAASFASRVRLHLPVPSKIIAVPPLLTFVQPSTTEAEPQPLIRRIDTTHQLLTVSLYLARQNANHVLAHEHNIHPTAQIGMQSRIAQEDCLIGQNVQMGIRCSVKETVIGANCEIGNNVKLTKCLLMDGVHVGDGVQLTGCIIGRRARIIGLKSADQAVVSQPGSVEAVQPKTRGKKKASVGDDDEDRTRLTECEVAPNFVVEAGTEAKGEKLMAFDTEGDLDDLEETDDFDDEDDG